MALWLPAMGDPAQARMTACKQKSGADIDIVSAGRERHVHLIKLKRIPFARLFGCHKAVAI